MLPTRNRRQSENWYFDGIHDSESSWARIYGPHDLNSGQWILLWDPEYAPEGGTGPPTPREPRLVGMVTATRYNAVYNVYNMCLLPEWRKRGLAKRLLLEVQLHAGREGVTTLTGLVERKRKRLRTHYVLMGARAEPTGEGTSQSPSLRLVSSFDPAGVEDNIREQENHMLVLAADDESSSRLNTAGSIVVAGLLGAAIAFGTRAIMDRASEPAPPPPPPPSGPLSFFSRRKQPEDRPEPRGWSLRRLLGGQSAPPPPPPARRGLRLPWQS